MAYNQMNDQYEYSQYANDANDANDANTLFMDWMNKVYEIVYNKLEISLDDLPDENYRISFENNMTPPNMANIVIHRYN